MKKKSSNPVITSFKEFKKAVKCLGMRSKNFGANLKTYDLRYNYNSGGYIHAITMKNAYEYYKAHNLWFD